MKRAGKGYMMWKSVFLSLSLFLIYAMVVRVSFTYAQPAWLKNGSYAIYHGKLSIIVFYDREYFASDYNVEYFDAYLKWNISEVSTDHLIISIKLEILNNSECIFLNKTDLKVDAHEQIIMNDDLQREPLMFWTQARRVGDIINLPNHTWSRITQEWDLLMTDAGAFNVLYAKASYDIRVEEEQGHLEWGYGFEKDSGLLVYLGGGIVDPVFKAMGIRYLVGEFFLKETNIPVKKLSPLTPSDIILIFVSRMIIVATIIGIIITMILKHRRLKTLAYSLFQKFIHKNRANCLFTSSEPLAILQPVL